MNYFHLCAAETSPRTADVRWAVGFNNRGVLAVEFTEHTADIEAAAELAAIRHLLTQKQVTGTEVTTGKGLVIEVSKGAVRKLWLGKSSKRHLNKYASYLRTHLDFAELRVAKHPSSCMLPAGSPATDHFKVTPMRYEYVDTPSGRIYITDHALERYKERMHQGPKEKAFASLAQRLKNETLRPVELPSNVFKHKERKYGNVPFVILRRHNDIEHFVIARHAQYGGVLVTVFERKVEEYRFLPAERLDEIWDQADAEELD